MKAMESQTIPILLILVAAFIGACAQYFFKLGSLKIVEIPIYKNWFFLAGLVSFFWVLVLITLSFRFGGLMMVVYPVYGTTYIWALLISHYYEKSPVNYFQVSGIAFIMLGISLVSFQKASFN
ncbi:MAG: DMT family transporter [Bacteriovorax sp.]|nr:DMT family transporter [Bacteriovorax sp.]